jgi:glycogen phosphorylase
LNDTHPAIAIIELLRILVDEENLEHEKAWGIVYHCFSYTNHTILPEALEKWPADLFGRLLPRHLEIIYLVNFLWLQKVAEKYPGNIDKLQVLSIIE